jgi:hypothetical protein
MTPAERSRKRILLPSLADTLFLGVLFFLTLSGDQTLLGDADTGYHVRAGEFILDHLTIPQNDIFSYLNPPLPWTLHEWFAEIVMAEVHRLAGLSGIVIFFSIVIALSSYLAVELLLKPCSNIVLAAAMGALVALSSASNWLARPHVITFLFLVVWYHLLIKYQRFANRKILFWMPAMMLLWVNFHGGFILGFVLLVIYCLGSFAQACLSGSTEKTQRFRKSRDLSLTLGACALIALVNPYGFHTLLFPVRVVQDHFLMDHVAEYLSPNFHMSTVKPFELLLLMTVAVFAVARTRLDLIQLALVVIFGHMALYSSRHIPLFAIVAGPIVLSHATPIFDNLIERFIPFAKLRLDNLENIDRATVSYFWPLVGTLLVTVLGFSGLIQHRFDPQDVPVRALEFVKRERLDGNMFNNDEFGDYIIYAGWPRYKVFIDGRTDMYGASRVKEYIKVTQAQPGWEKVLEKYQVRWIFHDPGSPLSKLLLERRDWKLIYSDKVASIFVQDTRENNFLTNKFRGTRPVTNEK